MSYKGIKTILNGIEFDSKSEAEHYVNRKLYSPSFDGHEQLWFDLLDRHPDKENKTGIGVDYFFVTKNKITPKYLQLNVMRLDETSVDISWKKCISQKDKTDMALLKEAMRLAIMPQIMNFKDIIGSIHPIDTYPCQLCGVDLKNRNDIQIDHVGKKFRDIAKEFIESQSEWPKEFDDCPRSNAAKFKPEDIKFEVEWGEFHLHRASYRVLCGPCNVKEG